MDLKKERELIKSLIFSKQQLCLQGGKGVSIQTLSFECVCAFSSHQSEPFIWSTMRQRPTLTCRSGMWLSWSWAATDAILTGRFSCASGKPSTGLSLLLFSHLIVFQRKMFSFPQTDLFPLFHFVFRYMVKHKSHLRFWEKITASIPGNPVNKFCNLPTLLILLLQR